MVLAYDEAFILERIKIHQQQFSADFRSYFDERSRARTHFTPIGMVTESGELLRELSLRGGKRQRVAFMKEAAALVAGSSSVPGIDAVALSIELLQSHLLIHDDIIDQSPRRRGGPSTIGAYRVRYPERPAQALGLALLTGDTALLLAVDVLTSAGLSSAKTLQLIRLQVEAGLHTFDGQVLDLERDTGPEPTINDLDTVSDYKAVRSSAYAPLALGLELVDGLDAEADLTVQQYAWCFGISGQMCDDWLSLFGDEGLTGKPATADVREGRRTYIIAEAFTRASPAERRRLGQIVGNANATAEDIEVLRQIVTDTGASAAVKERMRSVALRAQAIAHDWRNRWDGQAAAFFEAVAIWGIERNL